MARHLYAYTASVTCRPPISAGFAYAVWVLQEYRMRLSLVVAAASLIGGASLASAAPVTWDSGTGNNGNTYDIVFDTIGTWDAARDAASARGGELVIITSPEEQDIVESVLSTNDAPTGSYWFGVRQTAIDGIFRNIDGSEVTYTNWAAGQPDNSQGAETAGSILWTNDMTNGQPSDAAAIARRGGWNDAPFAGYPLAGLLTPPPDALRAGYLIEIVAEDNGGGGGTAIPLPAAVYAFPAAACVMGICYRRMRR